MEILAQIAQQYGLFVALVVYVIWDSRGREHRYLGVIDNLSEKFNLVEDIKEDVEEIKDFLK